MDFLRPIELVDTDAVYARFAGRRKMARELQSRGTTYQDGMYRDE